MSPISSMPEKRLKFRSILRRVDTAARGSSSYRVLRSLDHVGRSLPLVHGGALPEILAQTNRVYDDDSAARVADSAHTDAAVSDPTLAEIVQKAVEKDGLESVSTALHEIVRKFPSAPHWTRTNN